MELLWLLVAVGISMLFFRRLLLRKALPVNRQVVRHLLLQRLLTLNPSAVVVEEQEHLLTLRIGEQTCRINLDQLFRRCQESPPHIGILIRQSVQGFNRVLHEQDHLPEDWDRRVVPLLLHADASHPPDLLRYPVVDHLLAGYALNQGEVFRWITRRELDASGITEEQMREIALRNLERSCNALVIDASTPQVEGRDRLLRFFTADGLDATRLLIPSFYQRFAARFGDTDLLVAIPARDSLAMISAQDMTLASLMAWRSAREFEQQAYPLIKQLLRISESGMTVWPPAGTPVK